MQLRMLLQSNALARLRRVAAPLAASWLLAACGPDHDTDCLKGNGDVVTERRALDRRLRRVELYNNVDLTIVPDTATYAEVRAGAHVIRDIEFSTPGGPQQLVIKNTSRCNWVRSYYTPREVRLHVARSQAHFDLEQHGYGLITNEGQWAQDTLYLRQWSTGDFTLTVRSTYLYLDSYDAGDITLRGTAEDFHPNFGSTGFLFAGGLAVRYCYLYTYPAWQGDLHVRARDHLGGTLNGTGRLFYAGSPATIDLKGPNASRAFQE